MKKIIAGVLVAMIGLSTVGAFALGNNYVSYMTIQQTTTQQVAQ